MSDTNIILTISMLVSGRAEMWKSLESLHYFKDAFPCEVILVDTGCNVEQRALAEQYADKVIDFVWCNDFAAARNVGLKEAKGEWFLYLDDDEWFDNPQEIVDFFLSGEYKDYNSASYVVRNYRNTAGTMYDESYPSRMVKLVGESRFVGKIHEYLEPFQPPKKNFSDFVHHYGYVFRNKEEEKQHSERNMLPLLEMRKENPGNPRWMLQLAQEYFVLEEYEKVVNTCINGLEEWKTLRDYVEFAPTHVGALFGYILISLDCLKKFEEEKKWLERALTEPLTKLKYMEPTIAFYCGEGARMYTQMNEYGKARDYFRRYMEYMEKYGTDREAVEEGTAAVLSQVFQENFIYGTILICMESLIRAEDYILAEKAFYRMDWKDRRLLHQEEWERHMLDAFCSVQYHPLWAKLLQTLVSREDGIKEMYVTFLEAELDYKQNGETEKLSCLYRLVAGLDYEHRYILCTRILWAEQNPDINSDEECRQIVVGLLGKLFNEYFDEILKIRSEVWNVAERLQVSLEPLFLQSDYLTWKQMLEEWALDAPLCELQCWDNRIAGWKKQADIRYSLFSVKCLEGYLRHYREICASSLPQMEQMLWKYADNVLAFYRLYYKEYVFEEMPELLPDDAQFALKLKELQQWREQQEDRKSLECVRKCLDNCSNLKKVIDAYAKLLRGEVSQRNKDAEQASREMKKLAEAIKIQVRNMLIQERTEEAREVLEQLRALVPEDKEVRELLGKINIK